MTSKAKPRATADHSRDLARQISNDYGIDRAVAIEIVSEIFNNMKDILLESGEVRVKNWGALRIRNNPEMQYYDFRAREIRVISRNMLVFYPAASFKKLANCVTIDPETRVPTKRSKPAK